MADHSKAHQHATKAATAFKNGDGKMGRHHLGHAMMASRHAERAVPMTADEQVTPGAMPGDEADTAADMDDLEQTASSAPPSVPPKKPMFNRSRFKKS